MDKKTRKHVDDLRGATRLAVDATRRVTDLVQAMHATIAGGPDVLGRPLAGAARLVIAPAYGGVRAITRLVGVTLDAALAELGPLLGESAPGPEREAIVAVLNGVLGDYLDATGNPLATTMCFRSGARPLTLEREALRAAFPDARGKLLVLVHGSSMTDRQWTRGGHDHGEALARQLGYTPVYVLYNTGLHISTNGRALAARLDELVAAWPVPVDELVLLGHSMGGLVARSACAFGDASDEGKVSAWRSKLRALITLGAPHHGAALERGGAWVHRLLGVSRYSAPLARLGRLRSAGVTDLRYGYVADEDWQGRDRFAFGRDGRAGLGLPAGVACYAIAGSTAPDPAARVCGDGMVSVDSALGRHPRAALSLAFPDENRCVVYGTGHLDLLSSREVCAKIAAWLAS